MAIDKFGHSGSSPSKNFIRNSPISILTLTSDGNFNIQNKCLKNVKNPENLQDATTKNYVDDQIIFYMEKQENVLKEYINRSDVDIKNKLYLLRNDAITLSTHIKDDVERYDSKFSNLIEKTYNELKDIIEYQLKVPIKFIEKRLNAVESSVRGLSQELFSKNLIQSNNTYLRN